MDTARIAKAVAAIRALPEELRLVTTDEAAGVIPATVPNLALIARRVLEVLDDTRGDRTRAVDELVTLSYGDQLAGLASPSDGDYPDRRHLAAILDAVAESGEEAGR